jgi:hypothetical protein
VLSCLLNLWSMSCLAKRLPTGSGTDILTMLLYPRKRTWISAAVMSALCQKQTSLPLYSFAFGSRLSREMLIPAMRLRRPFVRAVRTKADKRERRRTRALQFVVSTEQFFCLLFDSIASQYRQK